MKMTSNFTAMSVVWLVCAIIVSGDMRKLLSATNTNSPGVCAPNGVQYQLVPLKQGSHWQQQPYWKLDEDKDKYSEMQYWIAMPHGIESVWIPVRSIQLYHTNVPAYVYLCTMLIINQN